MFMIGVISLIIYMVAILMIATNTYEFEKEKKLKLIGIGLITIFIITWIIVLISSSSIQVGNAQYLNMAKMTSVLIFAPINTIFALPYLGNVMNRYKQKRLGNEQIKKRCLILGVVLFIIFIIEINYIKSFELGLLSNVVK